jgi:hypothetical protein
MGPHCPTNLRALWRYIASGNLDGAGIVAAVRQKGQTIAPTCCQGLRSRFGSYGATQVQEPWAWQQADYQRQPPPSGRKTVPAGVQRVVNDAVFDALSTRVYNTYAPHVCLHVLLQQVHFDR